ELGFNFRLTNLQAAIGLALQRIGDIVSRKRWMGQEYTNRLEDLHCLRLHREKSWAHSVYWMYGVVLSEDSGMNATEFGRRLHDLGVETRPFFLGMHEQPVFRQHGLFLNERYPVTEMLARQGVHLPSGLALTEEQLSRVCDAVHQVIA